MQVCKNICSTFEGLTKPSRSLYKNGTIYCTFCSIGYKFLNKICPCCGGKVRLHSWSSYKRKSKLDQIARY